MSDNPTNSLETLIAQLKARGLLNNPRLEAAFSAVPRHLFLPEFPPEEVYIDDAIPTKYDTEGRVISSSSQPSMMLLMLHQLNLQPGHNVLEIGAGTGYNAAIMQHIVGQRGKVATIEYDHTVARQAADNLQRARYSSVLVVNEDGALGYAPRAAYDRIICTVGIADIPAAWVRQLKPNGIIVAPLTLDAVQVSAAFQISRDHAIYSEKNVPCSFVLMQGSTAVEGLFKRVGSSAMMLAGDQVDQIDSAALHLLLSADQESCHLNEALTAADMWRGLVPYIMLNHPDDYNFVLFTVGKDQKAYGMEGSGFVLLTPGSACFVPYQDKGLTQCFAGADAFMMVEQLLTEWRSLGSPMTENLRLRLTARSQGQPRIKRGRVYERRDHYLHAWLET